MKQVFSQQQLNLKEIDTLEPGTWINLVNPTQNESLEIANAFDIDIADLRAPLDAEEMSRITIEDEYTLIIVDVPITEEETIGTYYVTIPLGIIITETIITTCLEPSPFSMSLSAVDCATFTPSCVHALSSRFSTATPSFTTALRSIDRRVNRSKVNFTNLLETKS